MGVNAISQGPSYGNADTGSANATPFSVDDLRTVSGYNGSFGSRMIRFANHSSWRDPSTGSYSSSRTSDLGSCRGKSYWGWRPYVQAWYEYQYPQLATGVGAGLYTQNSSQFQLCFCSTNVPTTQSHYTSNNLSATSSWTSIVNSTVNNYNPARPSCYIYGRCGPGSASGNPLYIHFNGTNTGFTLMNVNLELQYLGTSYGIHEWVITSTTALQTEGASSPTGDIIFHPGNTYGYDWGWAAMYFASTATSGAKPSGMSYSGQGSTSGTSLLNDSASYPIALMLSYAHDNINGTIAPTISDLHPNGQGTSSFCGAGFYIGMR
jgi:hypothetical protein